MSNTNSEEVLSEIPFIDIWLGPWASEMNQVQGLLAILFLFAYFKQITFKKDEKCKTLCSKTYKPGTPEDMKKLEFLKNGIALNYQNHW